MKKIANQQQQMVPTSLDGFKSAFTPDLFHFHFSLYAYSRTSFFQSHQDLHATWHHCLDATTKTVQSVLNLVFSIALQFSLATHTLICFLQLAMWAMENQACNVLWVVHQVMAIPLSCCEAWKILDNVYHCNCTASLIFSGPLPNYHSPPLLSYSPQKKPLHLSRPISQRES